MKRRLGAVLSLLLILALTSACAAVGCTAQHRGPSHG